MRKGRLSWILLLFLSGLLLGVSLWNLDWAMWRRDFYLYYPVLGRYCDPEELWNKYMKGIVQYFLEKVEE